jgi:hypothetical protein
MIRDDAQENPVDYQQPIVHLEAATHQSSFEFQSINKVAANGPTPCVEAARRRQQYGVEYYSIRKIINVDCV